MKNSFFLYVFAAVHWINNFVYASCPIPCTCDLDELGRRRTRCEDGGLVIAAGTSGVENVIDLATMDYDVQVLTISGTSQRANILSSLSREMFRNKPYLQELTLSYCQINDLGPGPFIFLSSTIQVLNLTHNNLSIIHEDNFLNLTQLQRLHLDGNQIESFHSAMFMYLSNLNTLTVSSNRLNIVRCTSRDNCGDLLPRAGVALPVVTYIDLSRNSIGPNIPELFFRDFSGLRVLNLSRNGLETLPWQTLQENNAKLEEIDLSRNSIKEIQTGEISRLTNLKRFSLRGNPLVFIGPQAFSGLVLESLDLSGTLSTVLGADVFLDSRVLALNLSDMGLKYLNSATFQPISQDVVRLDVSGNSDLVLQPKMFSFLPQLRELVMRRMRWIGLPGDLFDYANFIEAVDLSQNSLLALDERIFTPLKSLRRLNLASNQLRRVPSSVVLPCIQEIDLSDNRLTAIPDAIIQALSSSGSSITSLHLNTNPWNCDCHLASLVHWLNGSDTGSAGKRAVCVGTDAFTCPVCYQPPQLRGISLDTLFVPPCDKNATLQSQFPQSWENNEPLTTLTGVVISNSIINNAVISNSVLRNVTSV